jgi:fibronectin-binding autotransporter adhesin
MNQKINNSRDSMLGFHLNRHPWLRTDGLAPVVYPMKLKNLLAAFLALIIISAGNPALAAIHIWSGAVNNNWSNPGNWSSGGPPTLGETPPVLLAFPPLPYLASTTVDDIGSPILGHLAVDFISITGSNYDFQATSGNYIYLTGYVSSFITENIYCSGTYDVFDTLPCVLVQTNKVDVAPGAALWWAGQISGPGGLTFFGLGTNIFGGINTNTFLGTFEVDSGTVFLDNFYSDTMGDILDHPALGGALIVGTTNNAPPAMVYLQHNTQIPADCAITINPSGTLLVDRASVNPYKPIDGELDYMNDDNISAIAGSLTLNGGSLYLGQTIDFFIDGFGHVQVLGTNLVSLTLNGTLVENSGTTSLIYGPGSLAVDGATFINPGSELRIQSPNKQVLTGLNMDGGLIAGGNLVLNGDIAAANSGIFDSPEITQGTISVVESTRTIDVAPNSYLLCYSAIGDSGAHHGVIKTGPGALDFYANNAYTGLTQVLAGRLGAVTSGSFLAAGNSGVVVSDGAELALSDGVNLGAIPLQLTGGGTDGLGALKGYGTNSWAGPITLASNASIGVLTAFTPTSRLTLGGAITGPGGLTKAGGGDLLLAGSQANSYAGATLLQQGSLTLNAATGPAIPGDLTIGLGLDGANGDVVRALNTDQLSYSNAVTISSSGLLDVSGANLTFAGSLSGSGALQLGAGEFAFGYDETSTVFSGLMAGLPAALIVKEGTGLFTYTGTSTFGVNFTVYGPVLVNGALPDSMVVSAGGTLGGTGTVGSIASTIGSINPGDFAPGIFNCASLSLGSSDSFVVLLDGAAAGSGYSKLNVGGAVSLGNATLIVSLGFMGAVGSNYTIIANNGPGAVTGTFNGLAEGAKFTTGGAQFQITYKGGDGNDVVLSQLTAVPPPILTRILPAGNGQQMLLSGAGAPSEDYDVQANTNLTTTNWIFIGVVPATAGGVISFTDPNAALYRARFYRLKAD